MPCNIGDSSSLETPVVASSNLCGYITKDGNVQAGICTNQLPSICSTGSIYSLLFAVILDYHMLYYAFYHSTRSNLRKGEIE